MKTGGSYDSVVLGVSEQAPQNRRSGQMWEQVNMISDPVRGVVRRGGSLFRDRIKVSGLDVKSGLLESSKSFRYKAYSCNGTEYTLLYSDRAVVGLVDGEVPIFAVNKDTKKFLPNRKSKGAVVDAIKKYGVSSMVNVGKFMFIAANKYVSTYKTINHVDPTAYTSGTLWVRSGEYARTYKVKLTTSTGTHTISYKTPTSSYPKKLDTSHIPVPKLKTDDNPEEKELSKRLAKFQQEMAEYNKKVADISNEYNSEVTKWIGEAAEAIQPANIANKLYEELKKVVPTAVGVTGSYVTWGEESKISNAELISSGDDNYMAIVASQVNKPENLTPMHYNGKVVRIVPKQQSQKDSYYMRAVSKDKTADKGKFTEVYWIEAAGEECIPESVFAIAYIDKDTLYIGSSPSELNAICPDAKCPEFVPSSVGDFKSSPLPMFLGKSIDYLGVTQDRLLIGVGSVIFSSRTGDYFNWFKGSVLAVNDNDPVEMYAFGSEDDTIKWDATFDRNHILFGDKYQYLISGRVLLSPKNPNIQIMSAHEDGSRAEPKASGNYVFFAKDTTKKCSLHQIQLGMSSDSSEAYECSQQLDKYLKGNPVEVVTNTAPYYVLMRTTGNPNGFYIYTYLDAMQANERLFDSWSRWEWDSRLGYCAGIYNYKGDIMVTTLRAMSDGYYFVLDEFNYNTALPELPYLDSCIVADKELIGNMYSDYLNGTAVAYKNAGSDNAFLGTPYSKVDTHLPTWEQEEDLVFGFDYSGYIILTSPYIVDREGVPITNGRYTLLNLKVTVENSGGILAANITPDKNYSTVEYGGRKLNAKANVVGRSPLINQVLTIPVYREIRDVRVKLASKSWLPFSVVGIEWAMQVFNNLRR